MADNTQQALQQAQRALARAGDFAEDVHLGEWSGPTDRRDKIVAEVDAAIAVLDAALSLPVEAPSDLHAAIMNLPRRPTDHMPPSEAVAYKEGHRDARHAAAELVLGTPPAAAGAVTEAMLQAGKRAWDEYVEHVPARVALTRIYLAMEAARGSLHLAGGASQSVREQAVAEVFEVIPNSDGGAVLYVDAVKPFPRGTKLYASPAMQAVAWMLYEHDDGRHAVAPTPEAATFAHGDPAWHRVGPVDVYAFPLPAVQTDIGSSVRHLAALVTDVEKEKAAAVSAAYEDAARIVEKRLVIHPKRSAIAKEIRAAALHQAHQKEGA